MSRIFLLDVTGYDPDTAGLVTWRFCTGSGFRDGSAIYTPRIENPGLFGRSISTSELGGRQAISYGEITLTNIDGALDGMADDFFDGRQLALKIVDEADGLGSAVTILRANIEAVAVERERVSIRLRDRMAVMDTLFSQSKYAGDNVLPYGLEGTADDLKDQQKPRIFGRIALMEPVLVNTSKLIYQVNDGPVDMVFNVFDAGAYLDRVEPDYDDTDDMQENAPEPGSYRCYRAGGYFRLGASPYGQISACVAESLSPAAISAAGLLRRVAEAATLTRGDGTPIPRQGSDWDEFGLQALDQKNAGSLGLIVQQDESIASLFDRICQSVGAFWGFDALGHLTVLRFDEPGATADMTLDRDDWTVLERQPEGQQAFWRVAIQADRNYAVQDKGSLAGVVSEARANWFKSESRDQRAESSAVLAKRLMAQDVTGESLLNGISIAAAEAQRRIDLFAGRRDVLSVTVKRPLRFGAALDIGKTIKIVEPRLGYTAGQNFMCIGVGIDYGQDQADLTLWG